MIGDKVKLKLRFLADQDPNYFAGQIASEVREGTRVNSNIPDLRAFVFTQRFRIDGTPYIARSEESLNFMPERFDTVPGLDVDATTGEKLTVQHLSEMWERDLDDYNRSQNAINPVQRRPTTIALPVTAPAATTSPDVAALVAAITANPEALAALLASVAPAATKPASKAKAKPAVVTPVETEIDQLPF